VWRLYGGWWDGNPTTLKPAPEHDVASAVVELAGAEAVRHRVEQLVTAGDEASLRLAGHLAEWLVQADPAGTEARAVRHRVFTARVEQERSTMSKGVFGWAARESL
jgi:alkyl sulfatase BDS1-like metallo-beta-lactamase superfamily hydrolase